VQEKPIYKQKTETKTWMEFRIVLVLIYLPVVLNAVPAFETVTSFYLY